MIEWFELIAFFIDATNLKWSSMYCPLLQPRVIELHVRQWTFRTYLDPTGPGSNNQSLSQTNWWYIYLTFHDNAMTWLLSSLWINLLYVDEKALCLVSEDYHTTLPTHIHVVTISWWMRHCPLFIEDHSLWRCVSSVAVSAGNKGMKKRMYL